MEDITKIPEEELRKDLEDSYADIINCEAALLVSITSYSGGSVQERLDANKGFIEAISVELARRQKSSVIQKETK